jgi:hypothetical protein
VAKAEIFVPYPRPQRVLAVDPGTRAGVAIHNRGDTAADLVAAWEVNGGSTKAIAGVVREFLAASDLPKVMVIERQFMKWSQGAAGATKGHETLLRRRHTWEVIAEIFGLPFALVYPVSWQSKMLPTKEDDDDDTKTRALRGCLDLYPDRSTLWRGYENARDAALLGRWYVDYVLG